MNNINGPGNQINNGVHMEQAVKNSESNSNAGSANILKAANMLKSVNENKPAENQNSLKQQPLNPQEISDAVDKANKLVLIFDKSTRFVYNQKLGVNFIDIVDNYTNEVIKRIPSEEMRRFMEAVETAVGMIVDEKA